MKLVEDLGTFKNNTESGSEKRGLFRCLGCNKDVEKRMDAGKIAKSCGCQGHIKTSKHGESNSPLYRKWSCMKSRCYDESNPSYLHYGGRGINVCAEWSEFLNFKRWAGKSGYRNDLSIERVDNDGNYSPSNCTFITMAEQQRNRQDTKLTISKVRMIRKLWDRTDLTQAQIGAFYNITDKYVSKITRNKVWVNV